MKTDALGRKTEYGYDSYSNLIYIINFDSTVSRTFYDNQQHPIHKAIYADSTDAAIGNINATLADTSPLLSDDGQPMVNSKTYYSSGLLKEIYDPYGHDKNTLALVNFSKKYEYDLGRRISKIYKPTEQGIIYKRYEYSNAGQLAKVIGPVLVGEQEQAKDVRRERIYDANKGVLYIVGAPYIKADDPNEKVRNITAYEYDYRFGIVNKIKFATMPAESSDFTNAKFVTVVSKVFQNDGKLASTTQNGVTIYKEYTFNDGLFEDKTIYPDSSFSLEKYNGSILVKAINRAGVVTGFEYDKAGRNTRVLVNSVIKMINTFDNYGRIIAQSDALGNTTNYSYDIKNNLTEIVFADGIKQFREYNTLGQPIRQSGANTYPINYRYNAHGQLILMTDGNGAETKWFYNQYGQFKKKLYAGSTERNPDLAYSYDLYGNIISRQDKKGITTRYHFDNINRLRGVDYPQFDFITETATDEYYNSLAEFITGVRVKDDIKITYDNYGRKSKIEDDTGVYNFTYDGISSRLNSEVGPLATVSYTYNNGELDKFFLGNDDANIDYLIDYTLDDGRLLRVNTTVNEVNSSVAFDYKSGESLLETMTVTNTNNSITRKYSYDLADRLINIKNKIAESLVSNYAYGLDLMGRRISVDKTGLAFNTQKVINYNYNERSELISAESGQESDYKYGYDSIGNRTLYRQDNLEVSGSYNQLNQIDEFKYSGSMPYKGNVNTTSGTLTSVSVDGQSISNADGQPSVALQGTVEVKKGKKLIVLAEDNQGRKSLEVKVLAHQLSFTYDANGNLKNDGIYTYYWNNENRLARVEKADQLIEFKYDYMGRRVEKKIYSGFRQLDFGNAFEVYL